MLYARFELAALLQRARHVSRSWQSWYNEGIVAGNLDLLAKDIDRDRGRLQVASAKYSEIAHPEAPALVADLDELVSVRQILFVPPGA